MALVRVRVWEGACPSPDYRNKLFCPHPTLPIARVIGNYAAAWSVVSNTHTTGHSLWSVVLVVSVVTSVHVLIYHACAVLSLFFFFLSQSASMQTSRFGIIFRPYGQKWSMIIRCFPSSTENHPLRMVPLMENGATRIACGTVLHNWFSMLDGKQRIDPANYYIDLLSVRIGKHSINCILILGVIETVLIKHYP